MKMTLREILTFICIAFVFVEAKWHNIQKRESSSICVSGSNYTNKVQCYCAKEPRVDHLIKSADCYQTTEDVKFNDTVWNDFDILKSVHIITFSNSKKISLKYIPTNALKKTTALMKLDIKYGHIEMIHSFAFANLTVIEEISLRDCEIKVLQTNAFSHHRNLITINLDKNNIEEINREVFVELPFLEKIFLTSNKITTIHDKAFLQLMNLKELEINMNNLFSLNSETFSGLSKLEKLDLSSNSLEVIGDNTFLPLSNLRSLNLEGNKIQMLDDKAFNGLSKLLSLSLAHNKLSNIVNVNTFKGLQNLKSLSLRANEISELKPEVMAPILNNFYDASSNLDVEDNIFTCDCRLDWFMSLMNKTQSKNLKLAIENLKCFPDTDLREAWAKVEETDKSAGQVFEEEEEESHAAAEYEYYDDTQLDGKLFYTDIRELMNCSNTTKTKVPKPATKESKVVETTKVTLPRMTTPKPTKPTRSTHKPTTASVYTTKVTQSSQINHGLLDLSAPETTPKAIEVPNKELKSLKDNAMRNNKTQDSYTTSRLATVSAKPVDNELMYEDEAKPDKLKAHRSVQDEFDDPTSIQNTSGGQNIFGCGITLISMLLCCRLF